MTFDKYIFPQKQRLVLFPPIQGTTILTNIYPILKIQPSTVARMGMLKFNPPLVVQPTTPTTPTTHAHPKIISWICKVILTYITKKESRFRLSIQSTISHQITPLFFSSFYTILLLILPTLACPRVEWPSGCPHGPNGQSCQPPPKF